VDTGNRTGARRESLMVQWALLVLSRVGAPPADAEAGPLFERWAA
jgi:hypothetical protein